MEPINFISALRETDIYIEDIYLNGGCYQFSKLLKKMYPNSETYINSFKGHVVTKIEDAFYDITGQVEGEYFPMTNEDHIMCEEWSFCRNNWLYRECPHCEEYVFDS